MKFAVKGAAVVALLMALGWLSPAHGYGVREYRMPPIDEPVCGDPDEPGMIAKPPPESSVVFSIGNLMVLRLGPVAWVLVPSIQRATH
jgi:hypothetical protein